MIRTTRLFLPVVVSLFLTPPTYAQIVPPNAVTTRGDSLMIRFVDVDLRAAVQALGRYLDRPIVIARLPESRVTLETPRVVPRSDAPRLLRGLLESQNVSLIVDSAAGVYRLIERAPAQPPSSTQRQSAQQVDLFVIRLKHARATEVAATVNALYGRASAPGDPGERSPTLARQLQENQIPPLTPGPPPSSAVATSARFSGEVTVVPDTRGNALLVRASAPDFALIQSAVDQIDIRPPQVLIEVIIAEVNRNSRFDFGVSVSVPDTDVGRGTTIRGSTSGAASAGDFVVRIMHSNAIEAEATISAAASRGQARILSRPVILAANNEPAEISVGTQRPFVQLSRVLATDNSARDQVVQYKDVGTRLSVTPTISADGYVTLQVTQEVNAATAEQAFGAPVISTRSIDTRLMVRDSQTVVLGGLRDSQRGSARSGVPILSRIPILGALFGHTSRTSDETELYIFLRPRIIRGDDDAEALTRPLRDRVIPPMND